MERRRNILERVRNIPEHSGNMTKAGALTPELHYHHPLAYEKENEMRKLWKFVLAAVLTTAAILSAPPHASAGINWCLRCADTGACDACCRCEGHPIGYCAGVC
jgi:hypothetical protein